MRLNGKRDSADMMVINQWPQIGTLSGGPTLIPSLLKTGSFLWLRAQKSERLQKEFNKRKVLAGFEREGVSGHGPENSLWKPGAGPAERTGISVLEAQAADSCRRAAGSWQHTCPRDARWEGSLTDGWSAAPWAPMRRTWACSDFRPWEPCDNRGCHVKL